MKDITLDEAWKIYNDTILASKKHQQKTERGRWNNHISPVLGKIHLNCFTALEYFKLISALEKKLKPTKHPSLLKFIKTCPEFFCRF